MNAIVEWWKSASGRDLLASVVVFLVALPLCMGIAIASGVPPVLGLITGMVGGVIVGTIAGSPLQVSGPAAGLAVLVWQFVEKHDLRALGLVVLGAGLIQLVAGLLKLGRWFRAVSPAVIQGMLAGIGVLIFASQFHVMVDDTPRGSGIENLLSIPGAIVKGLTPSDGTAHHIAALVGLGTITTLLAWNKFRPEKLRMIPGALVAVVLVTFVAAVSGPSIKFVRVPEKLLDGLNTPAIADWHLLTQPSFIVTMFAFALIASAETLLCATAVDRMHSGQRTNYDKELAAQGIGNTICGLLGALPMTGVIVRSSANVEAGAKTRASAIFHGFWLLAFVVLLPGIIQLVPTSALAAILVYTGYRLINPTAIKALYKAGKSEVVIYAFTVVAIVATDLLTGVAIGFGLALLRLLRTFLRLDIDVERKAGRVDVTLRGAATFVQLPRLAEVLESVDPDEEFHLHVGALAYADHAMMELLSEWAKLQRAEVAIEWDALRARNGSHLVIAGASASRVRPLAGTQPGAIG